MDHMHAVSPSMSPGFHLWLSGLEAAPWLLERKHLGSETGLFGVWFGMFVTVHNIFTLSAENRLFVVEFCTCAIITAILDVFFFFK